MTSIWKRVRAGEYIAVVQGKNLEILEAKARGGWRSWIGLIDDEHIGSWATLEHAKKRMEQAAKTR